MPFNLFHAPFVGTGISIRGDEDTIPILPLVFMVSLCGKLLITFSLNNGINLIVSLFVAVSSGLKASANFNCFELISQTMSPFYKSSKELKQKKSNSKLRVKNALPGLMPAKCPGLF